MELLYKDLIKNLTEFYRGKKEKYKEKIKILLEDKNKFIEYYKKFNNFGDNKDIFKAIELKFEKKQYTGKGHFKEFSKEEFIKDVEELIKDKWEYMKEI